MKLDTIEHIIETLQNLSTSVLAESDVKLKQKFVWDFNEKILNNEEDIINDEIDSILVDLAGDIEYYVANENHRKEFSGYFGEEELVKNIEETIKKLRSI